MSVERDTADIRRRLEAERTSLHEQLDVFSVANENQQDDYGASQHQADYATELFLRERNIPLRSNAEDIIAMIDDALVRLDQGTYGLCQRCGRPINPERLEAIPYAPFCLPCQSAVEQEA